MTTTIAVWQMKLLIAFALLGLFVFACLILLLTLLLFWGISERRRNKESRTDFRPPNANTSETG